MTPQQLAHLHHAAFPPDRPWSAQEFDDLLSSAHVSLVTQPHGFALIRSVAGEAELLTLAVDPAHRRRGIADRLMSGWMTAVRAEIAFLEVAADNTAARQLYAKHGFAETGRRTGYYTRPNGPAVDAVLMTKALTHR